MAIELKNGIYSFVASNGKTYKSKNEGYIKYQWSRNNATPAVLKSEITETVQDNTPVFSINERFEFLENYVSMVSDKLQASLIICGISGCGKSYTVHSALQSEGYVDISNTENFIEGERLPRKHYKVVKGFSTPRALFTLLYENKDSILIFDDVDNILVDPVAANLLKAISDSNSERIVSWNAESKGDSDIPRSFRFTGGVIFISNLHINKIPAAMKTRSVVIDVTMTMDERIERMEYIANSDGFMPEVDLEIKMTAMNIIKTFKNEVRELSIRSLIQTTKIFQKFSGEKAIKLAKYSLTV